MVGYWISTLHRFTIAPDYIRTEKQFSAHLDVTTRLAVIQGVSVYEGVLEALLGVGSIEISTASSQGGHTNVVWPHLAAHRRLARELQDVVQAIRHA